MRVFCSACVADLLPAIRVMLRLTQRSGVTCAGMRMADFACAFVTIPYDNDNFIDIICTYNL